MKVPSIIHVDFETRSPVDIKRSGVYPYSSHPDADILCMAWHTSDADPGDTSIWRRGEPFPEFLRWALEKGALLASWNAQFERLLWNRIAVPKYGFPAVKPEQWRCVLASSSYAGFPMSLGAAARYFGADEQKDPFGATLIRKLCYPSGQDESGAPIWNNDPELLSRLEDYCMQDVRTESSLHALLPRLPNTEVAVYHLDQRINDAGVRVDWQLVGYLKSLAEMAVREANNEMKRLTDGAVDSVSQVQRLKKWLISKGHEVMDCSAGTVNKLLQTDNLPSDVRRVLQIRDDSGYSSIAKLNAMQEYRDVDDRIHGLLQYHGAATGRWSGRGPQFQNLPRPSLDTEKTFWLLTDLAEKNVNPETGVKMLHLITPPLEAISRSLRRCLIPGDGNVFYGGDFSSVEARMLAWLSGNSDMVEAFRNGEDVYVQMASRIYGVPAEQVTKDQRFVGKVAVLGLGYGMGANKFYDRTQQEGMNLSFDDACKVVDIYRSVNHKAVEFWHSLQKSAHKAVKDGTAVVMNHPVWLYWECVGSWLTLALPSGRRLWYRNPRIVENDLIVDGYKTSIKQVTEVRLYGGLLAENVVQALCRDLLVNSLMGLERSGFSPVLSVHDEVLCEAPKSKDGVEEFRSILSTPPEWAKDFPLAAEVWSDTRYVK